MYRKFLYFALCIILVLTCDFSTYAKQDTGVIFLGDSRTVGMNNAIEQSNNAYFVAEVGKGYNWFVKDGISAINSIMENNKYISSWIIITNLGVNDLGNVNKYKDKYNELLSCDWNNVTLCYLSVNPVDESKCHAVTNKKIQEFNSVFAEEDLYIDTYSYVLENMTSRDGLHYSSSNYKIIYEMVIEFINSI